jgi:DNA polymerase III subunit epsilon
MKLKLIKPLVIFDLETTGLNITQDRIVELAMIKVNVDGSEEVLQQRINPEMPIPLETSMIHGIYDKDVVDMPTFAAFSETVTNFIGDADLAGFNSNKFDIPVLSEELLRVKNNFDMSARHFVDVQNIFHKMEQRTLAAASIFYCNKEIENAHNALADTTATWDVLKAQVEKYETIEGDIESLATLSQYGNMSLLDFAGRLAINDKDEAVYNFGKHKGKTIKEVMKSEPGYYGWMIDADFPLYTKQCLKREMEKIRKENNKREEKQNDSLSMEDKLNALKSKFK